MKRVFGGFAVAVAGAASLVGCGDSGDEGRKTFSMYIGEPSHLIPGHDQDPNGIAVMSGLFDGLVSLDDKGVVNSVAKSIDTKDQRHWTITLRDGRKFHNGEPVTAHSFVDAWNASAYGPNGWVNNYFFEKIQGYKDLNPDDGKPDTKRMSGLQVKSDTEFTVTLDKPFSQFPLTLAYTAFYPMPKAAFEDFKKYEQKPIGNGPFQMDGRWEHNKVIKVKRFPGYRGIHEPDADGIEFRVYSKQEAAYNDLTAGSLDVDNSLPPARLAEARRTFGDRYSARPSSIFHYLGFPTNDERFDDVNVRRAISMAIDRRTIIDKMYNGAYRPADSYVSPIVKGYRKGACGKWCTFDPEEAKRLLAKAGGWKGPMTLWFPTGEGYDNEMQAIGNQLKENLGISDVKVQQQPIAAYLDTLRAQKQTGPFRLYWFMDYPSPQNYLEPLYATGGSSNRIKYSNPKFDAYVKQGNEASSIDAGVPYYNKAEDLLIEDLPFAPLYFGQIQVAHSERVSDVKVDAFIGVHLWDVKVDD